jgi:hypothetical protein
VSAAEHRADDPPEARSHCAQELPGGCPVAGCRGARERHHRRDAPRSRLNSLIGHYQGHVSPV